MIAISAEQLEKLVAAEVAKVLTPECIAALAQRRVDERVSSLTLEEACRALKVKNIRSLRRLCGELAIPIDKLTNKIERIRISEIEAAQKRSALRVPWVKGKAA